MVKPINNNGRTYEDYKNYPTYLKRAEQILIYAHHSTRIVKLTTVVWCTKYRHELTLGKELISIFHTLVCTTDQFEIVSLNKAPDNIGPKSEGHAAIVLAPSCNFSVRIGPEKIA